MDENVANFAAITSATPGQAEQYLRLTDNNLEQAIQLYFEDPTLAAASPQTQASGTATATARGPSRPQQYTEEDGVVHIPSDSEDEDEDFEMAEAEVEPAQAPIQTSVHRGGNEETDYRLPAAPPILPPPNTEDDEEIARRLQEEMYQSRGIDTDGVRAPMGRTTETLVGGEDDDIQALVHEQMLRRQQRRDQARAGIFNQRDLGPNIWEEEPELRARNLAFATGGASEASSKSNMLAEMFRPPFEIMTRLPWDQARKAGRDDEKWLLVNVQDPSVFDCQALNRDIWKNKEIMECIQEHFIFLQYIKNDPRGENYINYYFQGLVDSPSAYPHIAIVDPRTGEQVKVWSGPPIPKANDFLMQLYEFLDRYSLKVGSRNPVAKRKPEARRQLDKMTEEEQLEMALANSLENQSGIPKQDEDPDALTKSDHLGKGKDRVDDLIDLTDSPTTPAPNGAHEEPASAFSSISSNNPHVEPPPDPATTTRIQFRYSGGRQVRRFVTTDHVRRIYEWLKASPIEGKAGVEFDLIFFGKNLIDVVDDTIEQAGLENGSIMVEFLGQTEE